MRNRRANKRRWGLTLIELLVVITIILVLAALAAAFMPRVSDSTNLSNSVDLFSQWLLTAKMRAKRDGLPTGLRFIADSNASNSGKYSQFIYIQQPDVLVGGVCVGVPNPPPANAYPYTNPVTNVTNYYIGGLCTPPQPANASMLQFQGVDFTGGQSIPSDYLVQPGDFLELRDAGGVHPILGLVVNGSGQFLNLSVNQTFALASPTTNYRILRQPRAVLGENALQLPGNMVIDLNQVPTPPSLPHPPAPPPNTPPFNFSTVNPGVSGQIDILFAPSGAVVGSNAGMGKLYFFFHDGTVNPSDPDFPGRSGIVTVQTLTGFIGAFGCGSLSTQQSMNTFADQGRGSGL
jgi:prepilin-type N-terminal cleavage/methylation domain-containing protein